MSTIQAPHEPINLNRYKHLTPHDTTSCRRRMSTIQYYTIHTYIRTDQAKHTHIYIQGERKNKKNKKIKKNKIKKR